MAEKKEMTPEQAAHMAKMTAAASAARAAKSHWPQPGEQVGTALIEGKPVKIRHNAPRDTGVRSGSKPFVPAFTPRVVSKRETEEKTFYKPGYALFYSVAPTLEIVMQRTSKEDIKIQGADWKTVRRGKLRAVKFKDHRAWASMKPDEDGISDVMRMRGSFGLDGREDGPWDFYGSPMGYLEALPLDMTCPMPEELQPKYRWIRSVYEMLQDPAFEPQINGFFNHLREKCGETLIRHGPTGIQVQREVYLCYDRRKAEIEAEEKQSAGLGAATA